MLVDVFADSKPLPLFDLLQQTERWFLNRLRVTADRLCANVTNGNRQLFVFGFKLVLSLFPTFVLNVSIYNPPQRIDDSSIRVIRTMFFLFSIAFILILFFISYLLNEIHMTFLSLYHKHLVRFLQMIVKQYWWLTKCLLQLTWKYLQL